LGTYIDNMGFEAEARRIAEVVWHLEPGKCQPMHYQQDPVVREIDGIARLRDVTHLIMVTTSTRLEKTKDQIKKLGAAEALERRQAPAVSKWIITERQLDAEHVELARKSGVTALTLSQFQRRFFDGKKYISLRSRHIFGSARDPKTDSINIAPDAYVSLPIVISADAAEPKQIGHAITLTEILAKLREGEIVVMRAPFGSGKSLTTRELFRMIGDHHQKTAHDPVPLALNLREHWGEQHSDEILDRHARAIGYTPREDLIVAWRAGMCTLLLDGFDELAAQSVVRLDNKNFMREARRVALQGVRDFTQKMPAGIGVFICGRDHYFDNAMELVSALGIANRKCIVVDLGEFDEKSASEFLRRNGIAEPLPDWLPRKPLILSYLLRQDLFKSILAIDGSKGFGFAWNAFLDLICQREASLERAAMEPHTVRTVLERLAQSVRCKSTGTGPITGGDLGDAYMRETGQAAGEGVIAQLQRLPGLTQRELNPENRSFVDFDMLGALQGSGFARQLLQGFSDISWNPLEGLSDKAIGMAAYLLSSNHAGPDTLVSIMDRLAKASAKERISGQHIGDCLSVAMRLAIANETEELDLRGLVIAGASIGRVPLDELRLTGVTFKDCVIAELLFGELTPTRVQFQACYIGKITGVSTRGGIPAGVVTEDCEITEFDNVSTNNAVLSLPVAPQVKALLTVLRKLYKQSGSGRKMGAFTRGITSAEVLQFIEPVINLLRKHEFLSIFNTVVHPVRKQGIRVEAILAAPMMSTDAVVQEAKRL
jgi:hypothetical protein